MKILPISDLSFREIISEGRLYADKTQYIHKMINYYKCCFLSRPRRFGKTLLLDAMEELFLGNRELFKGLWIDPSRSTSDSDATLSTELKSDYDFKKHPVIRLNMVDCDTGGPDALKESLIALLRRVANSEKLKVTSQIFGVFLTDLLSELSAKYGVGVVVLIDEYDHPVANHIDEPKLAAANAGVLHDFYAKLKSNLKYLRFVFVTGITRFALTAMDSGPNNFQDLSLDPEYAGVCGFTISEFDELFKDRMEDTLKVFQEKGKMKPEDGAGDLRKKILNWYDGYNWLGPERVLNPYSILQFFNSRTFDTYWPQSGQPTHLLTLIQERPMDFTQLKLDGYTSEKIRKVDFGQLEAAPVLFHSGYLTIDRVSELALEVGDEEEEFYSFKLPNAEVRKFYKRYSFEAVFGDAQSKLEGVGPRFIKAAADGDAQDVAKLFASLLSGVTHRQHIAEERYYHSLFHAALAASGLDVTSEAAGAQGQADMAIRLPGDAIAIIEVKYVPSEKSDDKEDKKKKLAEALDEALEAVKAKDYAGPFRLTAKKLIGLGLAVYGRNDVKAGFLEESDLRSPA